MIISGIIRGMSPLHVLSEVRSLFHICLLICSFWQAVAAMEPHVKVHETCHALCTLYGKYTLQWYHLLSSRVLLTWPSWIFFQNVCSRVLTLYGSLLAVEMAVSYWLSVNISMRVVFHSSRAWSWLPFGCYPGQIFSGALPPSFISFPLCSVERIAEDKAAFRLQ